MTIFPCIEHALGRRQSVASPSDKVMIMAIADEVYRKTQGLSVDMAQQVLDFINFLEAKHGVAEQPTRQSAATPKPGHVTNNTEDEVWSDLLFRQ